MLRRVLKVVGPRRPGGGRSFEFAHSATAAAADGAQRSLIHWFRCPASDELMFEAWWVLLLSEARPARHHHASSAAARRRRQMTLCRARRLPGACFSALRSACNVYAYLRSGPQWRLPSASSTLCLAGCRNLRRRTAAWRRRPGALPQEASAGLQAGGPGGLLRHASSRALPGGCPRHQKAAFSPIQCTFFGVRTIF